MADALAIVQAWQDAANRQDIDQLLARSSPDIEIVGPRGSGYGHQLLRDWLRRAGVHLTTLRAFARGSHVVVAQHGVWRSLDTGEPTGEREIASYFRVEGGYITRYARYDSLGDALAEAGLSATDEISGPL
jgi:hypothetical protein